MTTLEGPHGPLPVRIYAGGAQTLIWAHGGSFAHGGLDMPEADAVGRVLAERGITVVSVDYALASTDHPPQGSENRPGEVRFPVAVEEVAFVSTWARTHFATSRIAVGGASAGGNIAAGAILHLLRTGGLVPSLAVLAYPTLHAVQPPTPPELTGRLSEGGLIDQFSPAVVSAMYQNYLGDAFDAAPIVAVPGNATPEDLKDFPATVMVTSDLDELRVSGEAFAETLRAAGRAVEIRSEPGTQHGHLNRSAEPGFLPTIRTFAERLAGI